VQRPRHANVTTSDNNSRTEGDGGETAAALCGLFHGSGRRIRVLNDDDPVARRYVQIAEKVALAKSRYEHFFWIPSINVTTKHAIARAFYRVLANS
jgi:hypothetical protein